MKTIALTLFAAALGIAQTPSTSPAKTPPSAPAATTGKRPQIIKPSKAVKPSQASKTSPASKPAQPSKPAQASKPSLPVKPSQPVVKASPQQSAKAQGLSIPAGAQLVEPNLYRYTDAGGKTWMYRQTPFGISRWEEATAPVPPPPAKSEPVVVTDQGDTVRFEKKTPFGASTWVRKKTELNDEERGLLSANPAMSQVANKTKEEK